MIIDSLEIIKSIPQTDNISTRRGELIISRELLRSMGENALRELFSNFFPFATNAEHRIMIYGEIRFYGLSPHFREITAGEICPTYQVWFKTEGDIVKFDRMEIVSTGI